MQTKPIINALGNKIFWAGIIFCSTMFMPWRVIYKGTSVFTMLPLWWEYENPLGNYQVIMGHLLFSIIFGIAIAQIIKWTANKLRA